MINPPVLIRPNPPTTQEMVAHTVECLDHILPKMTSEWGRQKTREALRNAIREGTLSRLQVIQAADAGFREADLALREEFVEIRERGGQVPHSLNGYMQRASLRDTVGRGRGNELLDDFARNIAICVMVDFVRVSWSQKNNGRAFIIVSEALAKRHINLRPRTVKNIYKGLNRLTQLLGELIPARQGVDVAGMPRAGPCNRPI